MERTPNRFMAALHLTTLELRAEHFVPTVRRISFRSVRNLLCFMWDTYLNDLSLSPVKGVAIKSCRCNKENSVIDL